MGWKTKAHDESLKHYVAPNIVYASVISSQPRPLKAQTQKSRPFPLYRVEEVSRTMALLSFFTKMNLYLKDKASLYLQLSRLIRLVGDGSKGGGVVVRGDPTEVNRVIDVES